MLTLPETSFFWLTTDLLKNFAPKLKRKSWVDDSDAVRAVENTQIINAEYTEYRDSDTDSTSKALFTSRVEGLLALTSIYR